MAQRVKTPPAMQETRVWSLSYEDPLEEEMTTDSNILSWKVLWTEEPGGLSSKESDMTEGLSTQGELSKALQTSDYLLLSVPCFI